MRSLRQTDVVAKQNVAQPDSDDSGKKIMIRTNGDKIPGRVDADDLAGHWTNEH